MSTTVSDALLEPTRRPVAVETLTDVIDAEVADKSGLRRSRCQGRLRRREEARWQLRHERHRPSAPPVRERPRPVLGHQG